MTDTAELIEPYAVQHARSTATDLLLDAMNYFNREARTFVEASELLDQAVTTQAAVEQMRELDDPATEELDASIHGLLKTVAGVVKTDIGDMHRQLAGDDL